MCACLCVVVAMMLDAEIVLQQMREYSGLSCDFVMSERKRERQKTEREREQGDQLIRAVLREKPRRPDPFFFLPVNTHTHARQMHQLLNTQSAASL